MTLHSDKSKTYIKCNGLSNPSQTCSDKLELESIQSPWFSIWLYSKFIYIFFFFFLHFETSSSHCLEKKTVHLAIGLLQTLQIFWRFLHRALTVNPFKEIWNNSFKGLTSLQTLFVSNQFCISNHDISIFLWIFNC